MQAISERFRDKGLIHKVLYKFICLLYLLYRRNAFPDTGNKWFPTAAGKVCGQKNCYI